jgi:hypothetical protein
MQMEHKKILSIAIFAILATSSFTMLGAFTFFPVQQAEAQGLQLRVSAAQNPQFQNHFFGPAIIQVIIDDPGATDPDDSTVGLRVRGVDVGRVHLTDGLWYHFFAEEDSFGILMDVMTDGVRDNIIFVANPILDAPPVGNNLAAFTIGTVPYTQVAGVAAANLDSFIAEITTIGTTNFVEIDQGDVMPTLPNAFCDNLLLLPPCPVGNANPDLNIRGDTLTESAVGVDNLQLNPGSPFGGFGAAGRAQIDWPYIQLVGLEESDIVNVGAGSASVNLTFKDQRDTITATLDRSTDYPLDAEVINSFTDFMWNMNPVEEDISIFVLNKVTGTPLAVLYNPVRNFDPSGNGLARAAVPNGRNIPNLLPVLFRPSLQFDTRQLLEIDLEGMNSLQFNEFLDFGLNGLLDQTTSYPPGDDFFATFALPRTAGNSFIIDTSPFAAGADVAAWTAPNIASAGVRFPAVQMIESDPNTSYFESIDEQAGSRSSFFTAVNDKVASFDYFDIINSAPMTTHDGFATVDRELYNSADRGVFTVTDADQNLRSRVNEQPSAVNSNSFVKVGSPFPLGNNPTFPAVAFFGKETLPNIGNPFSVNHYDFEAAGGPADVYGADGLLGTVDDVAGAREGIEQVLFSLAFDGDDTNFNGLVDTTVDALPAAVIAANVVAELNLGTGGGSAASVNAGILGVSTTPLYPAVPALDTTPAGIGGAPIASTVAIRIDVLPGLASIVALDLDNDGLIEGDGNVLTGEAVFIAAGPTGDIAETNPQRSQKIGADFNTVLFGGVDRPSGVQFNTLVTLQDLAKFTEFTATSTQIRSNNIDGIAGTLDDIPVGQAFGVDPLVAATAAWTTTLTGTPAAGATFTHAGAKTGLTSDALLAVGTPVRVLQPQYNLINVDLSEFVTAAELVSTENFGAVAIQLQVSDSGTLALGTFDQVSRLVDFGVTNVADATTPGAAFVVGLMGQTKVGLGTFRVVDFLSQDWDDDGLIWPNDTNEPFTTLTFTVQVVFVDTTTGGAPLDAVQNEPAEVLVPGQQVGAVDFSGIALAIPPPVVGAPNAASFPAQRTIDEITLLASEHFVYRIQVKEQGVNSSIFSGRMDFLTTNQFDTTFRAVQDIVPSGDPAKAFMPNRFIPPNRLAFAYSDIDIVFVFRPTSASFIYETVDGDIAWDRRSFSFGQDAFLTLTDEDLNRRPDATERYDDPIAGFVFFELGKQRVVDNADRVLLRGTFILQIDATLLETGPNTGTFVSQISMFSTIAVSTAPGADNIQGTYDAAETVAVVAVQQQDLEANYIDVRDRSSIRQEFDDITNVRTTLGDVVLDRAAFPPGAIMYTEIHDNDFNTDVDIREIIDLRIIVLTTTPPAGSPYAPSGEGTLFSNVAGIVGTIPMPAACLTWATFVTATCLGNAPTTGAAPLAEITIFQSGVGRLVTLLPAGLLNLPATGTTGILSGAVQRFGSGVTTAAAPPGPFDILPMLDRNGIPVVTALETGPNTGIFEFETRLPGPAFDAAAFPITLPSILTVGTVAQPVIDANLPIQATYTDPADESGETEDEEELATFLFNTARLRTDKLEYGLGQPATIIMEEPDFNIDSRSIDQIAFSVLDVITDKFDTEDDPNQSFQSIVNTVSRLRTNQTVFRESGFNTGLFAVLIEELVEEFADRGEDVELVYNDQTPSGGGSVIRVEYEFIIVEILPEIVFDKEEYTPFDEVTISVISPDSNQDPDRIETIRVLLSSSSASLGRVSFPETGPNTGIFEEDFDLTPNVTQFPGDLRAIREDGVTLEFRIDEDTVASKSVFVNFHVGQVMFDKDAFRLNERGVLRVIDPDANRNPDTIDTLEVRFWSTTDRGGLLVTLRETGDRTGIFEEIVTFTPDEESSGTRLRVAEGDTITAKYTDNSLPAPAALDANNVFTVEVEELFSSALIGSIVAPLERAVAAEPELVDQTGAPLTDVSEGSQVLIQSEITNSQTKKQPFAYIVQIKDADGVTISLSWVTGELPAKESLKAAQSWIPDARGTFTVEIFVWESVDNPVALSPVRTTTVSVT